MSTDGIDPISGIEVATASARKLKDQRALAAWALIRYTVEALDEGAELAQVIAATGFEWRPSQSQMLGLFGAGPRSEVEAFANWIGTELATAIKEQATP